MSKQYPIYSEWTSINVCNECGSQVYRESIYDKNTCWNCGAVGQILLAHTRVSRRKVITGKKGIWPFRKDLYYWEYKEQTVPESLIGTGKFTPMVSSGITRITAIGLAGIGTGLF